MDQLIGAGLLKGYENRECCVCFHEFKTTPENTSWRSWHPCMHWTCDRCAQEWIEGELRAYCPMCKGPVHFTQKL